jgi:nucleoid DNA-binding protein
VITILFEEIIKDLVSGKKLKISNFGTIELKDMKPRRYHDVRFQKVMESDGNRIFRFSLAPKIRKRLCDLLDIDKTFGSD